MNSINLLISELKSLHLHALELMRDSQLMSRFTEELREDLWDIAESAENMILHTKCHGYTPTPSKHPEEYILNKEDEVTSNELDFTSTPDYKFFPMSDLPTEGYVLIRGESETSDLDVRIAKCSEYGVTVMASYPHDNFKNPSGWTHLPH